MADNVLETVQKLVQDVIAPDVRELKARVDGLERRMDDRFKSLEQHMDDRFKVVDQQLASMEQKFEQRLIGMEQKFDQRLVAMEQRLQFDISKVLAVLNEIRANAELMAVREVSNVRERVAILELQQKQANRAA